MNRIFFSSDFHCGHVNICRGVSSWEDKETAARDFKSVDEMNKIILDNINKLVGVNDTLYFLGDFCFGGHEKTPDYRNQINCKNIYFIKGNHDHNIWRYEDLFTEVNDVMEISCGSHKFFLSHYAHRVWPGSHKKVIHLYGHSHDALDRDGTVWGKSMDVSVDSAFRILGEYRPFSIEEIVSIMDKRDIKIVDHHDPKDKRE